MAMPSSDGSGDLGGALPRAPRGGRRLLALGATAGAAVGLGVGGPRRAPSSSISACRSATGTGNSRDGLLKARKPWRLPP
jgi:hypothetical protein